MAESTTNGHKGIKKVVIVGAGPAGLILALLLSKASIPSVILEARPTLHPGLRATQYGTPATRVFRRAGILDDIRAAGYSKFPSITWRRTFDHSKVVTVDLGITTDDEDRLTVIPLKDMLVIALKHVQSLPKDLVEVLFEHKVVDGGEGEESAWVEAETPDGKRIRFEGNYVVGCDGAKSTIRHLMFGDEWPGFTHKKELFVQNVFYDGFEKAGWDGGNYMIDPEDWGLVARRGKAEPGKPALWRITYGDVAGLTTEEYLKRREKKFQRLMPGNPTPDQYEVTGTDQFRTHNRCVTSMRKGRFFVASDAAHTCTPFGGYGCMAGVVDIDGLADCLIGVHEGKAGDSILTTWADVRRDLFLRYIDARSIKNMKRLSEMDPTKAEEDLFLKLLIEKGKNVEDMRAFLLKYTSFEHDFKQDFAASLQ